MMRLYNRNILTGEQKLYYSPIDFQFVKNMVNICKKDEAKGWSTFLFLMIRQLNYYVKHGGDPKVWYKTTAENFSMVNPGWSSVLVFLANEIETPGESYETVYDFLEDQTIPTPGQSKESTFRSFDKSVHPFSRWTYKTIRNAYYELK